MSFEDKGEDQLSAEHAQAMQRELEALHYLAELRIKEDPVSKEEMQRAEDDLEIAQKAREELDKKLGL